MEDRHKEQYIRDPLHLLRCAAELGAMGVRELIWNGNAGIEAAWPDDDDLDAAIPSSIGQERGEAAA